MKRKTMMLVPVALLIILGIFFLPKKTSPETNSNETGAADISVTGEEAKTETKPVYDPDASCAIYIYMCGSNLETKNGLAGKDIDELLSTDVPENVTIVIETGGAKKWHSHDIADNKIQRYLVKAHELKLIEETDNAPMGSPDTFLDFIRWSERNYPADRTILVMWDHGGDATEGVCYDENFDFKGLKQSELSALMADSKDGVRANQSKMDMVIFDTCFMGNLETVAMMKDYFHYMLASEVIMPGGGLNYSVIAEEFPKNDDESFGKLVCDTFMEECERKGQAAESELALYDLSHAEKVLNVLENVFAAEVTERRDRFADMTPEELSLLSFQSLLSHSAQRNTVIEGSKDFNVIDLLNFIENECTNPHNLKIIRKELDKLICCQAGQVPDHTAAKSDPDYGKARCTGVSIYYPFQFDRSKLIDYLTICPINSYAELLEDVYLQSSETMLHFQDRGSINDDGRFEITLTDDSKPNFSYLIGKLWKQGKDEDTFYLLGEQTLSLADAQTTLKFQDSFTGVWYHLNGFPLSGDSVRENGTETFHAKVNVNGENTSYNFRNRSILSGKTIITVGLVGKQFDKNGLVNRFYFPLVRGDTIKVLAEDPSIDYPEFTVDDPVRLKPNLQILAPGFYRFQFTAVALDGSYINSDYVIYKVTENGAEAVYTIASED